MKKSTVLTTTTKQLIGTINLPTGVKLVTEPFAGGRQTIIRAEVIREFDDTPYLINKVAIVNYLYDRVFTNYSRSHSNSTETPYINVNGVFTVDWDMKSFGTEGYNVWSIFQTKTENISLKSREQALAVINDIFPITRK